MIENHAIQPSILAALLGAAPRGAETRALAVLREENAHWERMAALLADMPLPEGADYEALETALLRQEKSYAALRPRYEALYRAAPASDLHDTCEAIYNTVTALCITLRDLRMSLMARHAEQTPSKIVGSVRTPAELRNLLQKMRTVPA
jgi:hypothetical protein